MAWLSECHTKLIDGVGRCSVPMWRGRLPAGFCDEPAYGPQRTLEPWERSAPVLLPYAPGLACPGHGGPKAPCCPAGCQGIDLGHGEHSGCSCGTGKLANGEPVPADFRCDCPNHPAPDAKAKETP